MLGAKVGRFKPVQDHIETLLNAFSTRRAARATSPLGRIGDTQWLANITHELRTPLNVVIGLSDMLINAHALKLDAARRSDYAQLIHTSSHHLLALIDGIMDMAKLDADMFELKCKTLAPGPVITLCADMLAHDAKQAGLDLRIELPPDLPSIVADQRALKQILINLLSNAIKFTERGHVVVGASADDTELAIWVEDSGIGIAADDLPQIGSPFFRARASGRHGGGYGLGLSIVKGLVGRHGGQLQLRSRVGEGTCVTVRLPVNGVAEPVTRPAVHDWRRRLTNSVPPAIRLADRG
jgi:two-component system, cell cycle sensor histidine kinase DivJ